ncbi:aminotransferase class V-fold PLP-dependent enzyme [Candidatus Neomarinimicrobiota bacterium]
MGDYQNNTLDAETTRADLLSTVSKDFLGLDTTYPLADGSTRRRIYLDSTASTLMMGIADRAVNSFMEHYANTHSLLHNSARLATSTYQWAHRKILEVVGASEADYTCFFTGSGTTAGMNRLARALRSLNPHKDTALVSIMEHHSNDLPHRKHLGRVIHLRVSNACGGLGAVDLKHMEEVLEREKSRVNYVAITGVSNVTGIINPIKKIAKLAHAYDALVIVDGAQMVAHVPVQMSGNDDPAEDIDALVFSGHKTYVPGSPGVVVARKDLLSPMEPEEVGGGMVDRVFTESYTVTDKFPDREEAGTPNIPGAIGLATAIEVLDRIGMEYLLGEETQLLRYALAGLDSIDDVAIYGCTDMDCCPRAASISFNVEGLHHSLVASVLNDYHNIAVRNECFCAHPYVIEMMPDQSAEYLSMSDEELAASCLPKPGMVRASFGLYNTEQDADLLVAAIKDLLEKREFYQGLYEMGNDLEYHHKTFKFDPEEVFYIPDIVTDDLEWLGRSNEDMPEG